MPPLFFVIPVFVILAESSHPPLLVNVFVHDVHRRSLFRPWYLTCICVGYWRAPPSHPLYFLVILHDNIAPTNAFPFTNNLLNKMRV